MRDLNFGKLRASLRLHEGTRSTPYDDATGRPILPGTTVMGNVTIGIGRNLNGRPLTDDEIEFLNDNDITVAMRELDRALPWWREIREPACRALIEMHFAMGLPALLGFKNMLAALKRHDWESAEAHCLNSDWARDPKFEARARTVAAQFKET